jgi:hypothetical protein
VEVGTFPGRVLKARGGQLGFPRNTHSKRRRSGLSVRRPQNAEQESGLDKSWTETATGFSTVAVARIGTGKPGKRLGRGRRLAGGFA